mgnify:CR=1 FL=1
MSGWPGAFAVGCIAASIAVCFYFVKRTQSEVARQSVVPDPTVTKLIHFGKQEECGGLLVRNLFAFSTAYPKRLAQVDDPSGPKSAEILMFAPDALVVHVAAWGNFPTARIQRLAQRPLLTYRGLFEHELHVFGFNEKTGEPSHPLYLPNATRLVLWKDAVPA